VTLTVTDSGGWQAIATHTVSVGDQQPSAAFSVSPSAPVAGQAVSFDGSSSSDPDGSIVSYAWTFGDGSAGSGAAAHHAYASPGSYTVTLSVTDNSGNSSSVSETVTVAHSPPVASFSYSPTAPVVAQAVSFDSSSSTDSDGLIDSYVWSFGDGSAGSGAAPQHAYAKAGSYTVRLTVTDTSGATGTATQTIAIAPALGDSGGGAAGSGSSGAGGLLRPSITNLSESHRVWREDRRRASTSKARRPPVGTTFSFALNEQAQVALTFARELPGRLVGGRCRPPTKRNRRGRGCIRTVKEATLYVSGRPGANTVVFLGQVSRWHWLPAGRYKLTITATSAAGQRANAPWLTFRIVG
jgi:PKD repeat protein